MKPLRWVPFVLASMLLATPVLAGCTQSQACAADSEWQGTLNTLLHQFFQCQEPIDDRSPCNYFAARALESIYGNDDFRRSSGSNPYLTANEIADLVAENPAIWQSLGEAPDTAVLAAAQECANDGRPVVAVRKGSGSGHVALIIPGTAKKVGSWNAEAPCSASFFLDDPKSSYVGCPLSYAFGSASGVKLYCRL